jgi:hypothetical protein
LQAWATKLVKEHDKNGNMILEPEEQGFLGSSAAAEDLNHDGKITIDEIVMHHSGGTTATAVASAPASSTTSTASTSSDPGHSSERDHERGYGHHDSGPSSDSRSKTDDPMAKRVLTGTAGGTGKDADKRHSYRFSKATDKLPSGLPPWFTSRDANKDGQISLSEYSHTMSESVVAEFRRYDTNDDGIITAKEAAKQK